MSDITDIIVMLESLAKKVPSRKITNFNNYLLTLEEKLKTQVFLDIYGLPGNDTGSKLNLIINNNPASEKDLKERMYSAFDLRDFYLGSPGYDRREIDGEQTTFTFSFVEFLEAFAGDITPDGLADWLEPFFGWDDEISPQPEMFLLKLRNAKENYRFAKKFHSNTFYQLYPIGFDSEEINDLLPKGVLSKTTKHVHPDQDYSPFNRIMVPYENFLEPFQSHLTYPSLPIKQSNLSYVRDILLSKKIIIL